MGDNRALFEENADLASGVRSRSDLDLSFIEKVLPIAERSTFKAGEDILKQGQLNSKLFFLLKGSVLVLVGGERVSQLNQVGDLIGEMSVISQKPVSATIRAETDVDVVAVRTAEISKLDEATAKQFQQILDRIYAKILTEKLMITNEKAKQFEIANRELLKTQEALKVANEGLEQKVQERTAQLQAKTKELEVFNQQLESQNTALMASHRKLEELYRDQKNTFDKLDSLKDLHLTPLQGLLSTFANKNPGAEFQESLKPIRNVLDGLTGELGKLTEMFHQARQMNAKRVLLVENNKKQQIIAKLALGGTGIQLEVVGDVAELESKLSDQRFDVIFLSLELLDGAAAIQKSQPTASLVLMTAGGGALLSHDQLVALGNFNLVARDENDRAFTVKGIMTTVSKTVNRDIFGLEKYLAWGVDVSSVEIQKSTERAEKIEQMAAHFKSLGMRNSLLERINVVTEELLMNAIYDAPVDENGKSRFNHLSRQNDVELLPRESARVRYACDGTFAAVSVADPFGGLQMGTLIKYLESCYQGQAGTLQEGKGGAGRGLHQIVENSDLVIFNVKKKVRTEVIALFNLEGQREKAGNAGFHFFVEK